MSGNGLRAYGFHADERPEVSRAVRPRPIEEGVADLAADHTGQADPQTVARGYLENAFASEALPELSNPSVDGQSSEFELLGIDESLLKETTTVRFSQTLNGVPVHGSLVTVELDAANDLVALNSAFGEPQGVSYIPTLTTTAALEAIRGYAGLPANASLEMPRLSYYYDGNEQRWRLVYVVEDVITSPDAAADAEGFAPPLADFVVDAQDGQLVEKLPRAGAATATGLDALNRQRQFETSFDVVTAGQQLQDATLNIHTQDFAFQDIDANFGNLPGPYVKAPPLPWNPSAVSAHANAELVASFLFRVLGRRGLDNRGGPLVSSINCVWARMGSTGRHWPNSFWIKNQVVYGQRQAGPQFRSFAAALDMVGHEFFHGVTQFSARLDYRGQSGALNESYSDIFGVLIANGLAPDLNDWRWEIGRDTGEPLRDLSNPARFGQPPHPDHMSRYQNVPLSDDFGGIHRNCGIHNRAAFNLISARDAQGRFRFPVLFVAQLFYHGLLGLGPTALFSDSRRSVELQARTMLRNDPQQLEKLNAIAGAFDAVGIV
jgi:bacillolysin/neutral peptidase B